MTTDGERIASLETEVHNVNDRLGRMETKIDKIQEQQSKWKGAIWILPVIAGIGAGLGELARHIPWK